MKQGLFSTLLEVRQAQKALARRAHTRSNSRATLRALTGRWTPAMRTTGPALTRTAASLAPSHPAQANRSAFRAHAMRCMAPSGIATLGFACLAWAGNSNPILG